MKSHPVSRGGLKLAAALDRFGLGAGLAGAKAIDIGASTGGFTDVLLRSGVAHVTAVDVGEGQLHPSLAGDPRVTSLEGVHWKTLPLAVAAGPFDFFTVDVSFIAARTMLRGLAFRLRPGAEGVVLVKPQFELADGRVRGGDVSDPNLRRDAVLAVERRAKSLGFTVVETIDSPVAGGSGTVEILAHLRFMGRSERLPQPGESRRSPPPKSRRAARAAHAVDTELRLFAVAAPGIEPLLEAEVAALPGARAVRRVDGGVELTGDLDTLIAANLGLRTATRLLVRLGEFDAREFAQLRRRAGVLAWERFIDPARPVHLRAAQRGSRLYHTGALEENLAAAIGDRLRQPIQVATGGNLVLLRGEADHFTVSIDSSGELLHRRSWRTEGAHAPLRETLAAALLLQVGWQPGQPLVDPMCGAGTIALEAAALAAGQPPGLGRDWAFTRWPGFELDRVARRRQEAEAARRPPATDGPTIFASDLSPAAVAAAERNAARAGLACFVRFSVAELETLRPPAASGWVIANPPYARRLGEARALPRLYRALGRLLAERFSGWRAALLVADERLHSAFGLPVVAAHPLVNGGIHVQLVELRLPGAGLSARRRR